MKPLSNRSVATFAAIVTIAASGFAVGAAATSSRDTRPDEQASDSSQPPTSVPAQSPTSAPGQSPTSTQAPSPSAAGVTITITKFAFDPPEVSAVVGSTVTWTNDDDVTHNVFTSDDVLASSDLERGDTYSVTMTEAGVIDYYCDIHQYMRGTITVTP